MSDTHASIGVGVKHSNSVDVDRIDFLVYFVENMECSIPEILDEAFFRWNAVL